MNEITDKSLALFESLCAVISLLPTTGLCAGVALGLMYELTEALFNFKSKKSFSHFKT